MNSASILRIATVVALAAGGAIVSAQAPNILPGAPKLGFGASVTPAYDGWFDNADGTHSYLIGYYSRNWTEEVDIPIGPNNHFEPGIPDRGQPTHFLPNRNFGMVLVTMPKEFGPTDLIWWVLSLNGITTRIPFHRRQHRAVRPGRIQLWNARILPRGGGGGGVSRPILGGYTSSGFELLPRLGHRGLHHLNGNDLIVESAEGEASRRVPVDRLRNERTLTEAFTMQMKPAVTVVAVLNERCPEALMPMLDVHAA